jgi:hypothetical protein
LTAEPPQDEAVVLAEGRLDMSTEAETEKTAVTTGGETSLLDQAKEALTEAGETIGEVVDDLVEAAKANPVATAAIAAGAAAAVAGAAFGISKLLDKDDDAE